MVLRLIPCSPRRRIRLVTVADGLAADRKPGRVRKTSASLTPATGARTTRLYRTQPHRSSCALHDRSRETRPAIAPDALASTAPHPNVRDDGQRPSFGTGWRELIELICPTGKAEYFRNGGRRVFGDLPVRHKFILVIASQGVARMHAPLARQMPRTVIHTVARLAPLLGFFRAVFLLSHSGSKACAARLWRKKTNNWRTIPRICVRSVSTSQTARTVEPTGYGAPFPCEPHHFHPNWAFMSIAEGRNCCRQMNESAVAEVVATKVA